MDSTSRMKSYTADIQDKIAKIYYSHGLFCSSHPYLITLITLGIFLLCCYPLMFLPLLGSSSHYFQTPVQNFDAPNAVSSNLENYKLAGPRWFQEPPVSYIQHIVVKSALSPWKSDLILTDAFRAPLSTSFSLNDILRNHQLLINTSNHTSLGDLCLQVSEPIDQAASSVLPQYNCLIISPSNIWKNDFEKFKNDPDIIKTIFSAKDSSVDPSSLREILFGVPFQETGVKKLFVRNRPRIITFAVTVVLKIYDARFINSLHDHIRQKFPTSPYPENVTYSHETESITHVQFQNLLTLFEFVPLVIAYVILFLYIYFSVYKIELVKSKWALAICAVLTVIMSLLMSVGVCLWFGLNPTLSGRDILPYLIVVIGLENMLVLTKSVVSTPMHLDVKLRVAQGLSKEGWSITKNLLTELALLMVAFLTFVPKIQEFCLFAVVGLLTDFFLQLFFFATFLSMDLRRLEVTDLQRNCIREVSNIRTNQNGKSVDDKNLRNSYLRYVQVGSECNSSLKSTNNGSKIFAQSASPMLGKLPKRIKFIYFWARTRMVQRALMVSLVLWLVFLVYSSGLVEKYTGSSTAITNKVLDPILTKISPKFNVSALASTESPESKLWNCSEQVVKEFSKNIDLHLKHQNLNSWQSLHAQHWTTLFGYYNISLSGRFISILPPIHISATVDADSAVALRNPGDFDVSRKSYWQFLSSTQIKDEDIDDLLSRDLPYHPSSPGEVAIAITLAIPSLLFFIYLMVVLYRCMCSKHYAEWRTSWKGTEVNRPTYSEAAADTNLVMETFPLKLCGHSQDLENICTDDNTVISLCLDGNINVWDSMSGECLTAIRRTGKAEKLKRNSMPKKHDSFSSDSTYSSSPQSDTGDFNTNLHCRSYSNDFNISSSSDRSNFPKHFSFDKNIPDHDVSNQPSQKYDFSRFAMLEDGISSDTVFDSVSTKDNCNVSHEFQSNKNSNFQYIEKGTKCVLSNLSYQEIWSMDFSSPCIAVGCKEGRIEVWNAFNGSLEYFYEENKFGVTALRLTNDRLIAARLNGVIEFFTINILMTETISNTSYPNYAVNTPQPKATEFVHCVWLHNVKAHSLSISVLEVDNGLVVSGGYDRLIKIFRTDSAVCIYTLHGHTAPISVLNIDQISPSSAASGCQDGLICLWDLMTGTCMFKLKGHQGSVSVLLSTDIYIISLGADTNICIWEKSQGHLLHKIVQDSTLHCNLMLLTNNIMVTTKEDNLVLWDVNHGEALRMIMVGSGDHSVHIRLLRLSGQSVVCDYGPHIFIINFPAISDKSD